MFEMSTALAGVEFVKRTHGDRMNKEWSRYETLATFPVESVVTPTRLAQAGFYYNGTGEEVVCFCCGLKVSIWTEGESVMDLHRRLSAQCRFICGDDTGNIPIHKDFRMKSAFTKGSVMVKETVKREFVDKHSHLKLNCSSNGNEQLPRDSSIQVSDDVNITFENEDKRTCIPNESAKKRHNSSEKSQVSYSTTKQRYKVPKVSRMGLNVNGQIELYPGITDQRPKHPDYALRSTRLASFVDWPAHNVLDPSILAAAGFYYAGLQDCVRCFFCSSGMRDWECGDNPWVEHARWAPHCAYVKLCKGTTFVNACRSGKVSEAEEHEKIPDDWLIESINSVAAKLVLGKGYNQEDVEKAIEFVKKKHGAKEVKIQFIMEYMHNENEQLSVKARSAVSEGNKQSVCEQRNAARCGAAKPAKEEKQTSKSLSQSMTGNDAKSEKQKLLEENQRLRDLIACKICMDNDACVALLPCGHLASCIDCSKNLTHCAICRGAIQATVRVYQA